MKTRRIDQRELVIDGDCESSRSGDNGVFVSYDGLLDDDRLVIGRRCRHIVSDRHRLSGGLWGWNECALIESELQEIRRG